MAGDSLIPFKRVELPGGPVSLVPVEQLQAQITELSAGADHALAQAQDFAGQAQAKMEEAGKMMADRWQEWPAQELSGPIREVIGLQQKLANLDAGLSGLQEHPHHGLSGVFEKLRDDAEASGVRHQQQAISQELKVLCEHIAGSAPPTTVPDADAARAEAASLVEKSVAFKAEAKAVLDASGTLADEVKRRQEAGKGLGFDPLFTAAQLTASGPEPIQTPLITKRGEQACFAAPASLSRHIQRTRYEGGSQGFSFPIGHTGIRYRVGSFRGRPVQWEQLLKVDSGTLIVTNQRLAFVGSLKSVTVPLAKVIHIEVYTDGLAVFHEGRENPDYFQCGRPQEFLLYLNWCLGQSRAD